MKETHWRKKTLSDSTVDKKTILMLMTLLMQFSSSTTCFYKYHYEVKNYDQI